MNPGNTHPSSSGVGLLALDANESPAEGVYRRLEGINAWEAALHQLLRSHLKKWNFTTIPAGVVLVTGSRSNVMSTDGVISGLLKRYYTQMQVTTK